MNDQRLRGHGHGANAAILTQPVSGGLVINFVLVIVWLVSADSESRRRQKDQFADHIPILHAL